MCVFTKQSSFHFCVNSKQRELCSPRQLPFWQGGSDPTSSYIKYTTFSIFACDLLTDPASVPRTTYYVSRILCLVSRTSYFVPSTSHPAPCTWHITSHFLFISYSLSASFIWFCNSIGHFPPHTQSFGLNNHTKCFAPRTSCLALVLRTLHHVPHTPHLIPHTMYHIPRTHAGHAKRAQASNL